jgi:hypothetical protein
MIDRRDGRPASPSEWRWTIKPVVSMALTMAAVMTTGAARGEPIGPVTPQAKRMVRLLDSMGVASKWQARLHVDWMTGLPAGMQSPEYRGTPGFVDAVAAKLAIDAGAPQDRLTNPSANRQEEFLRSGGGGGVASPTALRLKLRRTAANS